MLSAGNQASTDNCERSGSTKDILYTRFRIAKVNIICPERMLLFAVAITAEYVPRMNMAMVQKSTSLSAAGSTGSVGFIAAEQLEENRKSFVLKKEAGRWRVSYVVRLIQTIRIPLPNSDRVTVMYGNWLAAAL